MTSPSASPLSGWSARSAIARCPAGTAEAFLSEGQGGRAACIVTDIQLPGIIGISLKQRLHELGCAVPVIMLTGRTEEGVRRQARDCRPHCLLSKPFDAAALIDCIDRALSGTPA